MTLRFDPVNGTKFGDLPENYLPMILQYLTTRNRVGKLYLLVPEASPSDAEAVAFDVAVDPSKLVKKFANKIKDKVSFMIDNIEGLEFELTGFRDVSTADSITAIIDTGVAFWNPAFRLSDDENRISEMVFLGFTGDESSLVAADYGDYYDAADSPGGEAKVISKLGKKFRRSIYRRHLRAGEMSHGTAIADLVTRGLPDGNGVFAVELPARALLDRSGALLQAVLLQAIRACVQAVERLERKDLVFNIVLPYAFLGGPHSNYHPAVKFLEQALDGPSIKTINFFVPVGNHRQDRQHAQFGELEPDKMQEIAWRVHHDDYSSNSLDIEFKSGAAPTLILTTPDGSADRIELKSGSFAWIRYGRRRIGGVLTRGFDDGVCRVRLSIHRTAALRPSGRRAPYGDWTIAIEAADKPVEDVRLWILRDDRNAHFGSESPRRASEFVDPNYRERRPDNQHKMDDDADSLIKRAGTVSVLGVGNLTPVTPVEALHEPYPCADLTPSWYSGEPLVRSNGIEGVVVDKGWESAGRPVLGNGTARIFRVSGTSIAAAIKMNEKAKEAADEQT